jgi:hypothetical protein
MSRHRTRGSSAPTVELHRPRGGGAPAAPKMRFRPSLEKYGSATTRQSGDHCGAPLAQNKKSLVRGCIAFQ